MKKYGEFNLKGDEYIIHDPVIPRKWNNFIWNKRFLCEVDHDGYGKSFYKHPGGMRTEKKVYLRAFDSSEFPGVNWRSKLFYNLNFREV